MRRLAALILASGCASSGYIRADLDGAALVDQPRVRVIAEPGADVSHRATVLLVPADPGAEPIVQRQLLFVLQSELERRGYQIVATPSEQPQLLATVRFIDDLVTSELPAHYVSMPVWVPPRQWSVSTGTTGSWSSYGPGVGWGSFSASSNSTVTRSGYVGSQQVYVPPRSTVTHVAAIGVDVFDVELDRNVWRGAAVARTTAGDGRLAAHQLIRTVVDRIPFAQPPAKMCGGGGWTGIDIKLLSLDANNFVAVISRTNSAAGRTGVRPGQILESVDGTPVANRQYAELIGVLCGPVGSSVRLGVWDGSERQVVDVPRQPLQGATWE